MAGRPWHRSFSAIGLRAVPVRSVASTLHSLALCMRLSLESTATRHSLHPRSSLLAYCISITSHLPPRSCSHGHTRIFPLLYISNNTLPLVNQKRSMLPAPFLFRSFPLHSISIDFHPRYLHLDTGCPRRPTPSTSRGKSMIYRHTTTMSMYKNLSPRPSLAIPPLLYFYRL